MPPPTHVRTLNFFTPSLHILLSVFSTAPSRLLLNMPKGGGFHRKALVSFSPTPAPCLATSWGFVLALLPQHPTILRVESCSQGWNSILESRQITQMIPNCSGASLSSMGDHRVQHAAMSFLHCHSHISNAESYKWPIAPTLDFEEITHIQILWCSTR